MNIHEILSVEKISSQLPIVIKNRSGFYLNASQVGKVQSN
jgi:hypothetical protein